MSSEASDALLRKNKKIHWKILLPVGIEPGPLTNLAGAT